MGHRGEKLPELTSCPASWTAWQEPLSAGTALGTYPGSASFPDPLLRDQACLPAGGQASTSGSRNRPRDTRWGFSSGPQQHAWGADSTRMGSRLCWWSRAWDPAALCDRLSSSCANPCRCASLGDIIRLTKEPCYCSLLRGHSSFD